ncbi:MAG TPA: hypothetical protein PKW35_09420, partial [Nannocystaceae bacterium]|nr:hypothetical protein [Nannocystaceae bacterium]
QEVARAAELRELRAAIASQREALDEERRAQEATAARARELEAEVAALREVQERAAEERLRGVETALVAARERLARSEMRLRALTLLGEPDLDPGSPDDLKCITGIGPVIERKLREGGIVKYRDLAVLDDAAIERLEGPLVPLRARIRREDWVEQARKLHLAKYGEVL